jgi:flavodoxin I
MALCTHFVITQSRNMNQIGLFYGSSDGNTARVAAMVQQAIGQMGFGEVELFDVADYFLESMLEFDYLILGAPTWNTGQLQKDWEAVFEEFDELDFTGKQVALFGLGDQVGYPLTFADALFFIGDKVRERGATLVGRWPTNGYTFRQSWAVEDGMFIGLVLDEHNQPELTQARVAEWVAQLCVELYAK